MRFLGWALVHSLWQGALAAMALAVLDALLRRSSARLRYALAALTLLVMLLLPAATFVSLRQAADGVPLATRTAETVAAGSPIRDAPLAVPGSVFGGAPRFRDRLEGAFPALVSAWLCGVLLLSLRALGGWAQAQRVRRSGSPTAMESLERALRRLCERLEVSRPVQLLESALVEVPMVIGWLRPVVIFPASALTGLSPLQVEAILAHELAHVRRLDYLANLLQGIVETLLFYHPCVHWVSHRMRVEREHCCDDLAVAACGDALGYARALADLEGLRSAPRLALAASGGSLLERVARLVGGPSPQGRPSVRFVAAALALAAAGAALVVGPSLQAGARQESPAPPAPPSVPEPPEPPARPARPPRPPVPPAAATRPLPIQTVLELAGAGVTPDYIDEMAEAGYAGMTPEELLEARTHGVDAAMAGELAAQGLGQLSLPDLVSLKDQGVDADYVKGMKAAGYGDLSVSRLVALRGQGVDPEDAAAFKALGYDSLSLGRLIALRNLGVDADFVQELRAAGYASLSLPVVIAMREHGVDAEFAKELRAEGLKDLPAGLLIELRDHGVDADFVREMKQAGYDKLSPADLIQLRDQGVSAELVARLHAAGRAR